MLTQHIALVPEEAKGLNPSELTRVSAALQKQVARDLAPAWGVTATVDAFAALDDVPIGYVPVIVGSGELGKQAGVHLDDNGQPYAQVQHAEHWSLAASRAVLELLVNPSGTRNVAGQSLRSDQGPVEFVVELCGPCDDARYAYSVNGVAVADFCMPAFYEPFSAAALSARLTFSGAAKTPLQPLPGGHVTWYDAVAGHYWLRSHWGDNPIDTRLGSARGSAVRELLNACKPLRNSARIHGTLAADAEHAQLASQVRANRLRALLGRRLEQEYDPAFVLAGNEPRGLAKPVLQDALEYEPLELEYVPLEREPEPLEREYVPLEPEPEPLELDSEPLEYELVEPTELEEITLPETPAAEAVAAAAAAEPARSAAIDRAPVVAPSAPPPLKSAAPAAERTRIPSLAPVSLPSVAGAADAPRGKTPWIATAAALAAAASLIVWTTARDTSHAPGKHAAHAASAHGGPGGQVPAKPKPPAAEASADTLPQLALDPQHEAAPAVPTGPARTPAATTPGAKAPEAEAKAPAAEPKSPAAEPKAALATRSRTTAPALPAGEVAHVTKPTPEPAPPAKPEPPAPAAEPAAQSLAVREPASHLPDPMPAEHPVLEVTAPDVEDLIGSRK